jgi:hypothetical protein
MKIYHGTSIQKLTDMQENGIDEDSYFGSIEMAQEYADGYGKDGIIVEVELDDHRFIANILVNQAEYDNGDTDMLLDEDDLESSLQMYDSIVSKERIMDFSIMNKSVIEFINKKTNSDIIIEYVGENDLNNYMKDKVKNMDVLKIEIMSWPEIIIKLLVLLFCLTIIILLL